jgi:uracil-DNA glycosylase
VLIIGQAPGSRVHALGEPWRDASGDRLREWLAVTEAQFYDPERFALMPMGLCYPGSGPSGDLPPRPECAPLWHDRVRHFLPDVALTILVGQYAQKRYLPTLPRRTMTEHVRHFADAPGGFFPLPHPSWRSTNWIRKNPWFAESALPSLQMHVALALAKA